MQTDSIHITGAGLVGSLLSILLAKKGFQVDIYEKRPDPRRLELEEGRSINLALSHRGIRTLKMAGLYDVIKKELIPMKGRMMHDTKGDLSCQPYGKSGQYINSVSRLGLNKHLIDSAQNAGVNFYFEHKCMDVDIEKATARYQTNKGQKSIDYKVLLGSDGAYSPLRQSMQQRGRINFTQYYIKHGYKELTISPKNNEFLLEPNYLHIWPRGNFMLIALPNPDKSFTCTLFFPFEGSISFNQLKSDNQITDFFEANFPDIIPFMPDYLAQYKSRPTSSLVTINTDPWYLKNCLLVGDASHAIVPFYGQGMNAGFEDCRLLIEWGEKFRFDWSKLIPYFSEHRKKDTDAIAELALKNFEEMRDRVADQRFLDIKKAERRIQEAFPEDWLPLYSMVTFSDMPYHEAMHMGKLQESIMNELPDGFDPDTIELKPLIDRFNTLKQVGL